MNWRIALLWLLLLLVSLTNVRAAHFTNSTASAIQASFLTEGAVSAGDTVVIRGGTYLPTLTQTNDWGNQLRWYIEVSGATNNPITFRAYPGERVVLDGPAVVYSQFVKFLDLEIINSNKGYQPTNPSQPLVWVGWDAQGGPRIEVVNCFIHDVSHGFSGGFRGEVRGCIFQYVGLSYSDHVAYTSFDSFRGNVSLWTSGSTIQLGRDNMVIRDNILVQNNVVRGAIAQDGSAQAEMLITAGGVVVSNNVGYHPEHGTIVYFNGDGFAFGNTLAAHVPLRADGGSVSTFSNNSVYMNSYSSAFYVLTRKNSSAGAWTVNSNAWFSIGTVNFDNVGVSRSFAQWKSDYPTFDTVSTSHDSTAPPDSVHVFKNQDDPKRANIGIFNWTLADNVSVNLSGVLNTGDTYRLFSAQDYGRGAILVGTYNGSSISVPMTNLPVAALISGTNAGSWGPSLVAPASTGPEFVAFVVIGAGGSVANVTTVNVGGL